MTALVGFALEVLIRHANFIPQHGDPLMVWMLEFPGVSILEDGSIAVFRGRGFRPFGTDPFAFEHFKTP